MNIVHHWTTRVFSQALSTQRFHSASFVGLCGQPSGVRFRCSGGLGVDCCRGSRFGDDLEIQ